MATKTADQALGQSAIARRPNPASPSRCSYHRRDPSPDGMGQAVPDGGQLGHLGRDRLGLNEAPHSLGFVGCRCC